MKKTMILFVMVVLATSVFAQEGSKWWDKDDFNEQIFALEYEGKDINDSLYTYTIATSKGAWASASDARKSAKRELQRQVGENEFGDFSSTFQDFAASNYVADDSNINASDGKWEEAFSIEAFFKSPKIQFIREHTDTIVDESGKKGYVMTVLGRYLKSDVKSSIEKIDSEETAKKAVANAEKKLKITFPADFVAGLTEKFEELKNDMLESDDE